MEKIREQIKEIESRIVSITGDSLDPWNHWVEDRINIETVEDLLLDRCNLSTARLSPPRKI